MIAGVIIAVMVVVISFILFPPLRKYFAGFSAGSLFWLFFAIYIIWQSGFMEEKGITVSKIKYYINEKYNTKDDKVTIVEMTTDEMKGFFENKTNFELDRIKQHLKNGSDAVSLADVTEDTKAFSMIAYAQREKKGFMDKFNWGDPDYILFMINPCVIDFKKTGIPDDIKNLMVAKATPPDDLILVTFRTIQATDFKKKGTFKVRDVPFHPISGIQAIAVREIINKYTPKNNCFKNI